MKKFNALVHVHCVPFICRIFPVLLVLSYYMVNKDGYIERELDNRRGQRRRGQRGQWGR